MRDAIPRPGQASAACRRARGEADTQGGAQGGTRTRYIAQSCPDLHDDMATCHCLYAAERAGAGSAQSARDTQRLSGRTEPGEPLTREAAPQIS